MEAVPETIRAKTEAYAAIISAEAERKAALDAVNNLVNDTVTRHHHELIEARRRESQAAIDWQAVGDAKRKLEELRQQYPGAFQE